MKTAKAMMEIMKTARKVLYLLIFLFQNYNFVSGLASIKSPAHKKTGQQVELILKTVQLSELQEKPGYKKVINVLILALLYSLIIARLYL